MKFQILAFIGAAFFTVGASAKNTDWQADYSELLGKYVDPSGVDYDGWHANQEDMAKLRTVVASIANTKPTGSESMKLAFYLNAYNAWILHNVLERYPYSNKNLLARNNFFGKPAITVSGKEMSFNDLEHGIIREEFDEPRVHVALNCASASCPPLLDRAYRAESLDADLTAQTQEFVSDNPLGVSISRDGKTASISAIFDWFAEDFGDVRAFINKYRDEDLGPNVKIKYQKYDWSRNEAD